MGYLCFNCATRFPTEEHLEDHDCEEEIRKRDRANSANDNLCQTCGKTFAKPFNLRRHSRNCKNQKESERTVCKVCRKTFTHYTNRYKHEKKCKLDKPKPKNPSSSEPNSSTSFEEVAPKHMKCRKCDFTCSTASDLYAHRMTQHFQADSSTFQDQPWGDGEIPPWENEDGTTDVDMRLVYNQHKHLILKKKVTEQTAIARYNFPVSNNVSMDDFKRHIEEMYGNSSHAFKVNLSFGIMLRHVETGRYRYFAPYSNETVFNLPLLISCRSDIDKYIQKLSELDILNYISLQRPNTSWKPVMICNVLYTLFKTSFALGNSKRLPNFIKNRKSIISLECDPHCGKPFDDDLCMFRCLAYHEIKNTTAIERLAKDYFSLWLLYAEKHRIRNTDVCVANIPHIENCFEININVFSLNRDRTCVGVYKSMGKFPEKTMYLNLYESHLSYIANFRTYASKYRCCLCDRMFPSAHRLNRHAKTCENATKLRFPGGYYKHSKTVFDRLEEWNIFVAHQKRFFPWFRVFDLEAVLIPEQQKLDTNRKLLHSHKAICVCLCSNVPGFEKETFILNENKSELLQEMCDYLTRMSNKCQSLAKTRWENVYSALNQLESKWCSEAWVDTLSDSDSLINGGITKETGGELNISEARDSNDYEPPSAEFLEKMSKENVWYRFMRDLSKKDTANVAYNEWDMDCSDESSEIVNNLPSQTTGSQSCGSSRSSSSSSGDDGDDDDDMIQPFRPLNAIGSQSCSSSSSSDDDNDDDDDMIQPFRPLNARNSTRITSDDDDDDDDDGDDLKHAMLNSNKRRLFQGDNPNCFAVTNKKIRIDRDLVDGVEQNVDIKLFPEVSDLMKKKVQKIKRVFETYCQQLPVLGFNSGKYDINLIKSELVMQLGLHKNKGRKFVIKKNNNYTCLANSNLKFLDMSNYLPPGTSYDSFLVSFNVPVRKSFFPYEYLTDASKLDESCLPPPECFYSSLKNCSTLENKPFLRYSRLIEGENKSSEEALKILKLDSAPSSSIRENYAKLQSIWKEKK